MAELFVSMMKEEWRIHSTMFGSISFALFPVMIFGIAFMGSFLLPLMRTALPAGNLALITHANFLLLGFMVGAFGLLGNEVMNRRFGQASLLAYSARSLPLSERYIFTIFVIKDIVYYFCFWVLPFGAGYIAASPITGVPLPQAFLLLCTLTLSFLYGLCVIFSLSAVYARSKTAFWFVVLILGAGWGGITVVTGMNPALLFPPLLLYASFSTVSLLVSCVILLILFCISIALFTPDAASPAKEVPDIFASLHRRLASFPHPPLAAKDMIDLYRSGSLVGQTLFSFAIPLGVIWFFLTLLSPYFPPHGLLFMFAILSGVIGSTMYTWVTMFDTFGPYACLPVSVGSLIASKFTTFSFLQLVPAVFIGWVAVLSGDAPSLLPAVVLCLSVSFYAAGVTVWLTGLSPNVLVYDVRVLLSYLLLVGIAVTIFTAIAFAGPVYALSSVLLLVPAWLLTRQAMVKWDAVDQAGF